MPRGTLIFSKMINSTVKVQLEHEPYVLKMVKSEKVKKSITARLIKHSLIKSKERPNLKLLLGYEVS